MEENLLWYITFSWKTETEESEWREKEEGELEGKRKHLGHDSGVSRAPTHPMFKSGGLFVSQFDPQKVGLVTIPRIKFYLFRKVVRGTKGFS